MCGIVGFSGKNNIIEFLLNGLEQLEYRGYDSCGISILSNSTIKTHKAVGKLENLKKEIKNINFSKDGIGLGHTRWATHGKPTKVNAHPHTTKHCAIVHNGIIENYKELKDEFKEFKLISQTDSEIIVHIFDYFCKTCEDKLDAFSKTIDKLDGSYAILLAYQNKIFFAKKNSPLMLGKKDNNIYLSSSETALFGYCKDVFYCEDDDYGYVYDGKINLYKNKKQSTPNYQKLHFDNSPTSKNGFRFFMEKEIYEQSIVSENTISDRVYDNGISLDTLDEKLFKNIDNIIICACGTSYHAGLSGSYLLQRLAKIFTNVEIASEFRYKNPIIPKNTLFITISQSGETADTLEVLKMVKKTKTKTLSICNIDNSSIVRLSDYNILTKAGTEKGVASTKAFSTQVLTLWMLSLYIAKLNSTLCDDEFDREIKSIKSIPQILKVNSSIHEKIKRLSKRYLDGHGFFFIGRDIFYPLALEGALKLKEISYFHAEGYPAGEMKHGPIALVDSKLFTIALLPKNTLYKKTKNNIEELSARDSTICAISPEYFDLFDDFIRTTHYDHCMQEFFEMTVILQLFSMEIAIRLNNDIDMPRNLAKSVTVE
jgi:glucosamine--fructose-6-phosphate aminotransferase (isomerizing)